MNTMPNIYTCRTSSGPDGWNSTWKCQFPFQYRNEVYTECKEINRNETNVSWCSTKVTGHQRNHTNTNWGYCSPECKCKTVDGYKGIWKEGDRCQFPFRYSGKEYNGCIVYETKGNDVKSNVTRVAWCSTKVHPGNRSHIHRHWGYCSEDCPVEKMAKKLKCENGFTQLNEKCKKCFLYLYRICIF